MLEYAYNVAHYQVTSNKHMNDGDTIGLTDEVQAVAHLARVDVRPRDGSHPAGVSVVGGLSCSRSRQTLDAPASNFPTLASPAAVIF